MDYYMYMLESYHPGSTYGVVHLPDNPDRDAMLVKWILAAMTQAHQDIIAKSKSWSFFTKNIGFLALLKPMVMSQEFMSLALNTTGSSMPSKR